MLPNPLLLERLAQQNQQAAERLGRLQLILGHNRRLLDFRLRLVAGGALVLAVVFLATLL